MKILTRRSEFTVFIFSDQLDHAAAYKAELSQAGYNAYVFNDQSVMVSRIEEAQPQAVIFSLEALETTLSEFVEQSLSVSSGTHFLCLSKDEIVDGLEDYKEHNLHSICVVTGRDLNQDSKLLLWSVDSLCEKVFFAVMNEQLFEEIEHLRKEKKELSRAQLLPSSALTFSVKELVQKYKATDSKEDLLGQYLGKLKFQALFMKYLPTVQSFVATYSQGIDLDSIRGVGARLNTEESARLNELTQNEYLPPSLREVIEKGLGVRQFAVKSVTGATGLDGVFVFWSDHNFDFSQHEDEFLIFQLLYQNIALHKKAESTDNLDSLTSLLNRHAYFKKVEEEMARAKRLLKPVSLIKLSMDHFQEVGQQLGKFNRDVIIKAIAGIISKTSRVNDIAARTGENEISLILPHCAKKGAALRAERLRRIIEQYSFSATPMRVAVSLGVSEYPSLAPSGAELDASATQALEFISHKGGNKVCLFKPVEEFKPDFEVNSV
ncbi:MAG: GGDEF domain-containing protein [Proteobacteria bacterium]|nr:GGDEF domain-containing protein [Pseudomonadota bacterium]